jgi:hypothetical protein
MSSESEKRRQLNTTKWKVEHRSDGLSFIAYPWIRDGKVTYAWVCGPMDPHVADWLMEAIEQKQSDSK